MQFIQEWCQWLFDNFLLALNNIITIAKRFYDAYVAVTWIFLTVLWFGVCYASDVIIWIGAHVPDLITLLNGALTGRFDGAAQLPGPLATGFAVMNHFLPLVEFFGCLTFILSTWALAVTIRAIKAWIPTLA